MNQPQRDRVKFIDFEQALEEKDKITDPSIAELSGVVVYYGEHSEHGMVTLLVPSCGKSALILPVVSRFT